MALCEIYRLIMDPQVIFCQKIYSYIPKYYLKNNNNALNTPRHACDLSLSNEVFCIIPLYTQKNN